MNELKRVYGRKTVIVFAVIIILNFVIFTLSCGGNGSITAEGDELSEYISSYDKIIENTLQKSRELAMLNIYDSGFGSFGSANIAKTSEDFSALSDIVLTFGNNRGITVFAVYHMTDLIYAAFMIIISASLLAERKNGLANLIRSTAGGRIRLYFSRTAVLAFSTVWGAVFLYGGNILGAYFNSGDMGLSRAVQSVPEFSMCVYRLDIGGYLLCYICLKALAVFSAAVLFFTLISLAGTAAAYICGGALAAAELLFYIFIPDASGFNIFKFINIFTAIKTDDYFVKYLNLNIFGRPVSILFAGLFFCVIIILICFISGIFIHGKMYLKTEYLADRIILAVQRFSEKHPLCRTLFGWEGYKLIVRQFGGLIIMCAFFAAYSQAVKYAYFYPVNTYELEWYAKYEGEMTYEMLSDMEIQTSRLERSINMYESRLEKLLSEEPVDWDTYGKINSFLEEARNKYNALVPIAENVRDGMEYTEKTGNKLMLIKPYSYDLMFRRDEKTVQRNSLFILIGIICAVSGVYSFERQNRMDGTLRSAYRGRVPLNSCKIIWVILICILLCTAVHSVQLIRIGLQMGLHNLDAPLQSLEFMRNYPYYMPIIRYIIMIFGIRAAAACTTGLICVFISRLCGDRALSMGISAFTAAASCLAPQIIHEAEKLSVLFWLGEGIQ